MSNNNDCETPSLEARVRVDLDACYKTHLVMVKLDSRQRTPQEATSAPIEVDQSSDENTQFLLEREAPLSSAREKKLERPN